MGLVSRILVVALIASSPGCRSKPDLSKREAPPAAKEAEPTGRADVRREVDETTGKVTHESAVLIVPGRGAIKHGIERVWYPDGALHWEREFRFGKPSGVWRSWWENGKPRTECYYFGPDVERTMTFWREDGQLAAQGPACDGSRRGRWKLWWSTGQLSDEGEYRAGFREGPWQAWSQDGKRHYEIVYQRSVRISKREIVPAEPAETPPAAPQ